jgi:Histidine kinase-, DNA gyrase B-, and HSP90-like ATPase
MTVHNIGFLLDRLGQDCHPLQYLRELTQNAIEAVLRSGVPGEIVWDVDWTAFDLDGIQKLSITDTGDGMTGEEMVRFINQLSSSMSAQSLSGNYGVGAKIAAATRNPAGVLYLSWKNGDGSMIHLYRDEESGQYGLKQWRHQDGSYAHYLTLDDDVRPEAIRQHGTKVVLLGVTDDCSTMQAPPNTPSPSRWISKYLNTRYYRFPEAVTVKVREGWEYPRSDRDRNYLRTVTGQQPYLSAHQVASGTVPLTDALAHWWILKDEPAISNNSGFVESAGHVGALYQDELYELATARAGMSRLQQFGVVFGYRYVVIYVEPAVGGGHELTTNTSRTSLIIDSEPLPWTDWAEEFRENLPKEIAELVAEKAAAASNTDHSRSIRDRLRDILDLFRISRYRPTAAGSVLVDEERIARGGRQNDTPKEQLSAGDGGRSGAPGGGAGNLYAIFEKPGGTPGKRVKPDPFPVVKWVTVKNGTREYGDIEDRAAKYHADQNLLLANADFRVFADMVTFFVKEFDQVPGIEDLARDAVRGWFEQALVEAVMGVQGLMNSREWSQTEIDAALSEEALTTAVMQRYHVHFAVKRELASKVGSRRAGITA